MKTRESSMPDEELWASFFQPDVVLDRLALLAIQGDVVEFGCGYGTFTIPIARRTTGIVYALDIEADMLALTAAKATAAGRNNVRSLLRDFVSEGTGLRSESTDCALLFNILHAEQPDVLLAEALRVLRPRGLLAIMHWNYDESTPRGPSIEIRPHPEQCRDWAHAAGFDLLPPGIVDLPPYHYGMVLAKTAANSVTTCRSEQP